MTTTHDSDDSRPLPTQTRSNENSRSGSARSGTSRNGNSIMSRLGREWDRIARRAHAIERANQWNLPGEPVDHLDVVLDRCGFDQVGNADHHDAYLSALVRIASHDQLAARIVLQRILPGLVSIAVRRAPITPNGLAGAFDLVTSAAWLVIRQFPIDRRPRRVAANLLMDIEYLAFVRDSRLKSSRNENSVHPDAMLGIEAGRVRQLDHSADPVGDETAFELLLHSFSLAGLAEKDLQMLRAVGQGIDSTEAAGVLGLSSRSVRNRRANALERALALLTDVDDQENSPRTTNDEVQRSGMSS